MPYSNGVAFYYDLFRQAEEPPDEAAEFLRDLVVSGERVLDIGAGTGTVAFELAKQGALVTALEPDNEMYGVMLARLAAQHELAKHVTPIFGAAGFQLKSRFDLCVCFSVLHLLSPEKQTALIIYARDRIKEGGRIIFDVPMRSSERVAKSWSVTATRELGDLRVEHHSALEQTTGESWLTHWKFVEVLGGTVVREVTRTFRWQPLTHERSENLLLANGLDLVQDYSGYGRGVYEVGRSRNRLVVARAT